MKSKRKKLNKITDNLKSTDNLDLSFDKKRLSNVINRRSSQIPDNIESLFHATDIDCLLREDIAVEGLTSKQALKNAKQKKGNFFISPRTFEKDA